MAAKLGIIAGSGPVPARVAAACRSTGRDIFILALDGQTDPETVADTPHKWIHMGEIRNGMDILHSENVTELVFVGPVIRPSMRELKLDGWAIKKAALMGLRWIGDNSILSTLIKALEEEGFTVVGAHDLLDDCIATAGNHGGPEPTDQQKEDIRHGLEIARAVGELDIGQAAVVQDNIVLGVEGVDGTDALIRRCGPLQRASGSGAVLVKACKPQQERRIDMPTIGVGTVRELQAQGFSGVAVEAGRALIFDAAELCALADEAGIFVIGVEP